MTKNEIVLYPMHGGGGAAPGGEGSWALRAKRRQIAGRGTLDLQLHPTSVHFTLVQCCALGKQTLTTKDMLTELEKDHMPLWTILSKRILRKNKKASKFHKRIIFWKQRHLVAEFATNASGTVWRLNLLSTPSGG